jgi:hypothetical protein
MAAAQKRIACLGTIADNDARWAKVIKNQRGMMAIGGQVLDPSPLVIA